ncbi:MAG: carboxynorspermidine decarboxylase, partial [Bacillota bacterium]
MLLQFDEITTPAFIYDEMAILQKLCDLQQIQQCNILYPLKPCEFADILRLMTPFTSGFSVSSLYEATLAKEMLKNDGVIHLTTPGLRP